MGREREQGGGTNLQRRRIATAKEERPAVSTRGLGTPVGGPGKTLRVRLPGSQPLGSRANDTEGMRTPAGRAQWISSSSP